MATKTAKTQTKNKLVSIATYTERYFEGIIALAALTVIFFIILLDIIRRTLFGSQLLGGFEISIGLFMWVAWLTASMAVRHESHFRFTLFRRKMSQRSNMAVYIIEWVLWLVVIGVLFTQSIDQFQQYVTSGRYLVGTPIQEQWVYLAIPVSAALILVRVVQNIYFKISRYRLGKDIRPDATIGTRE